MRRIALITSAATVALTGGALLAGPAMAGTSPVQTPDLAPTTTTLTVSPSRVAFGTESAVQFSATVTSATNSTPAGSVVFSFSAGRAFCTATLVNGTGKCSLDTELQPGRYQITASYLGSPAFAPSVSSPQVLTVLPTPGTN